MGRDKSRAPDPATGYVRMFNAFFANGDMTATYKPVFLKCLLDLGKYDAHGGNGGLPGGEWVEAGGDAILLDLNFVAARLVRYYWDMEDSFELRQTSNPGDAKIIQIVRNARKARKSAQPPTLDELASASCAKVRREAITHVIKKQVLAYLLTDMPSFYERLPGTDRIRLAPDTIPFFRRHRATILAGLNHKFAAHLEKLNRKVPQSVARHTERARPSVVLSFKAAQFLGNEQQQRCFYCDEEYAEKTTRIDHVLARDYVFFANLHNCVTSCVKCSMNKRGRPPSPALFLGVLDRNDALERRLAKLPVDVRHSFADYDGVWYRKTYTACLVANPGDAEFFRP